MKTIKIVLNSKVDSFGTKTVVFMAKEGGIFAITRDEGSHSDMELGKEVVPDYEIKDGNCTL